MFQKGDRVVVKPNSPVSDHKFYGEQFGTISGRHSIKSDRVAYWVTLDIDGNIDFWEDELAPAPLSISQKIDYVTFDLPSELGKFWVVGVNRGTNEMWVVDNSGLDRNAAAHVVNALNNEAERGK